MVNYLANCKINPPIDSLFTSKIDAQIDSLIDFAYFTKFISLICTILHLATFIDTQYEYEY